MLFSAHHNKYNVFISLFEIFTCKNGSLVLPDSENLPSQKQHRTSITRLVQSGFCNSWSFLESVPRTQTLWSVFLVFWGSAKDSESNTTALLPRCAQLPFLLTQGFRGAPSPRNISAISVCHDEMFLLISTTFKTCKPAFHYELDQRKPRKRYLKMTRHNSYFPLHCFQPRKVFSRLFGAIIPYITNALIVWPVQFFSILFGLTLM